MKNRKFLLVLTVFLISFQVVSQIEFVRKSPFYYHLKIENKTSETIQILNPCSYYRLRKDNTLSAYKNYKVVYDTVLFFS